EESVQKLYSLIRRKRKEWAAAARRAREDEFDEDAEEEQEEHDEEGDNGDEGWDDNENSDEPDKDEQGPGDPADEGGNEEVDEGGNEEGEEEAEDNDDPILEVSASPSTSCHMEQKRDKLAKMRSEIAELERKLGSSVASPARLREPIAIEDSPGPLPPPEESHPPVLRRARSKRRNPDLEETQIWTDGHPEPAPTALVLEPPDAVDVDVDVEMSLARQQFLLCPQRAKLRRPWFPPRAEAVAVVGQPWLPTTPVLVSSGAHGADGARRAVQPVVGRLMSTEVPAAVRAVRMLPDVCVT
ncbi:unnamed protein product, partial [Symbiodinium necroappetens]